MALQKYLSFVLLALFPAMPLAAAEPWNGVEAEGYLAVLTEDCDGMKKGEVVELERALGNARFQVCVPRGSRSAIVPVQALRKLPLMADASSFDLTQAMITAILLEHSADYDACRVLAQKFAPGERTDQIVLLCRNRQKIQEKRIRIHELSKKIKMIRKNRRWGLLTKEELELQALEGEIGELYTQVFEQSRLDAADRNDFFLAFLIAETGGNACLEIARDIAEEFPSAADSLTMAVDADRKMLVADYRVKADAWRKNSSRVAAYQALWPETTGMWNESLPLDYRAFRKQIAAALLARLKMGTLSSLVQPQHWGRYFLEQNCFLPVPDWETSFTPEYDRIFDAVCAREAHKRTLPAASAPGTANPSTVQGP